jgi:proline iminopeptidase
MKPNESCWRAAARPKRRDARRDCNLRDVHEHRHDVTVTSHLIPPPRDSGMTRDTAVPLYWAAYGPEGSHRTLVLHGGPGAHHDYLLPQLLSLSKLGAGRELLFYDQRGGGRSKTSDPDPITWRTHVRDMADVIAEFALLRPTIVGYSWGALLALLYAAEAMRDAALPRPARLVLIDPAAIARQYRDEFEREFARRQNSPAVQMLRSELASSGLRERDPDAFRHRSFELSVAGYFADPASARDLTPFRVMSRVQQSVWDSLGDYDLAADGSLASIATPTLVVHGRQDPIPLESSRRLAEITGARLAVLEDCGHVPYVEQPERLFAEVETFLDDTDQTLP